VGEINEKLYFLIHSITYREAMTVFCLASLPAKAYAAAGRQAKSLVKLNVTTRHLILSVLVCVGLWPIP
jgi:hypothetical protein